VARRDKTRPDHRRTTVAEEAARIMQEQGLTDFRSAKEKAVLRLGLEQGGALPSNEEIAAALARRNRIFRGDSHGDLLGEMRRAAVELMRTLEEHRPRLVGALLDESATEHSRIEVHATNDAPEAVGATLEMAGIAVRYVQQRLRLRRDEVEAFPALRLRWRGHECLVTVFPERTRGHAPLSPVDGRPMRRAAVHDVEALLAAKKVSAS
jgi:hypothetical protein